MCAPLEIAMAEIHILPARSHSADHVTRLTADLAAAQEQGADLGSRVAHIQADGEALLAMGQMLEQALGAMRKELSRLGVQDQPVQEAAHLLLSKVQQLAEHAKCYPSGH
jgi:hypothetical protein